MSTPAENPSSWLKQIPLRPSQPGQSAVSREMDDKEQAIWLGEVDIPEDISIEAGKRHKKIASEDEEE